MARKKTQPAKSVEPVSPAEPASPYSQSLVPVYTHPPLFYTLAPWQQNFLDMFCLEIMGEVGDTLMVMNKDGHYWKLHKSGTPDNWIAKHKGDTQPPAPVEQHYDPDDWGFSHE